MTKTRKLLIILLCAAFIAAVGVCAVYDLQITKAVRDSEALFGRVADYLGEPPAILLASFTIAVIMAEIKNKALIALFAVAIAGGEYYIMLKISKAVEFPLPAQIAAAVLLAAIFIFFAYRIPHEKRRKIFYQCVTITIVAVGTLILSNLLKLTFGRVRPFSMDADYSQYTPFWKIDLFNFHNRSFPSGHTGNATVLYSLTLFTDKSKSVWVRVGARAILLAYIALLAFSRVLYGAHFATDVLFGFAVTMLLFFAAKKYMNNYLLKKGLERL